MFAYSAYQLSILTLIGMNVILVLSLNVIMGFCGQVSLGHAAFYGMGAYTAAILAKHGMPIWVVLPCSMLLTGFIGLIVGFCSLRVRDDFLAIATMAVGFIFLGIIKSSDTLGGEMGITGIPNSGLSREGFVGLVLAAAILVIIFCLYVRRSWLGFAFSAVAVDEEAAQTIGIDVRNFKLAAFSMGTAIAGLAGGLLAYYLRFVGPEAFGFLTSVSVLLMVALGGMGSVFGCVMGATLLTLMPEVLRFTQNYKLLIFGILLFLLMRFFPEGLAGIARMLRMRLARS
jgi:branched-chain amino acid transport system permease protein